MNNPAPKSLTARFRAFFTNRLCLRWFAHFALVEVLIFCVVFMPSMAANAAFTAPNGNFKIWVEAGKDRSQFAIQNPSTQTSVSGLGGGDLIGPIGRKLSGNYPAAPNGLVLRDLTTNEVAPLPDNGNGDVTIPPSAWTGSTGSTRRVTFLVEDYRGVHQFAVRQENGTTYSATVEPMWGYCFWWQVGPNEEDLVSAEDPAGHYYVSATFDPSQPFRLLDLTWNQQCMIGKTFATWDSWTPISAPPPLQEVRVVLPAFAANQNFTVHTQVPWGPVMQQVATAVPTANYSNWAINTSSNLVSQNCALLTFTAPVGGSFWITKGAGDRWPAANATQPVPSSAMAMYCFDALNFPPPPPPPQTVPVTLRINAEWIANPNTGVYSSFVEQEWQLWTNAGMVAEYAGYQGVNFDVSTFYYANHNGQLIENPISLLTLTAQVPEDVSWWVVNATTGETMPIGQRDFFRGWTPHVLAPGAVSSLDVHSQRLNPPEYGGAISIGIAPAAYDLSWASNGVHWISVSEWNPYFNSGLSLAGELVHYDREFWNQGTYEYYTLPYTHVECELPAAWQGEAVLVIYDDYAGLPLFTLPFSAGATDDTTWLPPPQPVYLNISESRWGHDLALRHVDGREYPIYPGQTQGNTSWVPGNASFAWSNSYYYFDANTQATPGMAWYIVDKTSGETAGYGETNLAAWYYVPPPLFEELAAVIPNEVYSITFTLPSENLAAVIVEVRTPDSENNWAEIERIVDGIGTTQPITHQLSPFHFDTMGSLDIRLRSVFGDAVSQASQVRSINVSPTDSDGDGLSDLTEQQLGTNPLLADTDGDRINDGREVTIAKNPLDSLDGRAPLLRVVSGGGQAAWAGDWALQPVIVRIANGNDLPFAGQSVRVRRTAGGGGIAATFAGATAAELILTSDANGLASFYYQTDSAAGAHTFEITSMGWTPETYITSSITSVMLDSATAPPLTPLFANARLRSPKRAKLNWSVVGPAAAFFQIEKSADGGATWTSAGSASGTETTWNGAAVIGDQFRVTAVNHLGIATSEPAQIGASAVPNYAFVDLGTMRPFSVNSSGVIVGYDSATGRPAKWVAGVLTELSATSGIATSINDAGVICGTLYPSGAETAFRIDENGVFTTLPALTGNTHSAWKASSAGDILGTASHATSQTISTRTLHGYIGASDEGVVTYQNFDSVLGIPNLPPASEGAIYELGKPVEPGERYAFWHALLNGRIPGYSITSVEGPPQTVTGLARPTSALWLGGTALMDLGLALTGGNGGKRGQARIKK